MGQSDDRRRACAGGVVMDGRILREMAAGPRGRRVGLGMHDSLRQQERERPKPVEVPQPRPSPIPPPIPNPVPRPEPNPAPGAEPSEVPHPAPSPTPGPAPSPPPGSTRRVAALFPLAVLALSAACQQPQRAALISADGVLIEMPLVRQDELYECGFASVAALCAYYQVPIPEQRRDELLRMAEERKGLSGAELRAELETLGMDVFIFQGTLDRAPTGLYAHVDSGRPVLVMTSRDGESFHYCLFNGYDETLGNVFLLDPQQGLVVLPAAAFDHQWGRAQRFALLCAPATESKEIES
ncbi:MAG: hypothetical protein EYC70_09750 [Planctomycetota bacterium]|nr:MAG: hypothetical protein EYC70_09750 [Planctomycetota bacterium]